MKNINPDGKNTYSTLIRCALGDDVPAPLYVQWNNGQTSRNRWDIEIFQSTPAIKGEVEHWYFVSNYANICDTPNRETYKFYDHNNPYAKQEALKKAEELNTRDRCVLGQVT